MARCASAREWRTVTAAAGDLVVVEARTYHRFASAGDQPAHVLVRVEPAMRMEDLFESVAALAADGRTLPNGMPKPLDLALFMREFEDEVQAPIAPELVRAMMKALAALGERRGLSQRYRHYHKSPVSRMHHRRAPVRPGAGRTTAIHPLPARPGGPGTLAYPRAARRS